jgi:hypothetical protein
MFTEKTEQEKILLVETHTMELVDFKGAWIW